MKLAYLWFAIIATCTVYAWFSDEFTFLNVFDAAYWSGLALFLVWLSQLAETSL